jgi:hypothetical protein
MKLEFSPYILEKSTNIRLRGNPYSVNQVLLEPGFGSGMLFVRGRRELHAGF